MADKEKDVPIKEREDGTVLARVEVPEGFDDEDEKVEIEVDEQTAAEAQEASDDDADADEEGENEDDREIIREALR